MNFKLKIATLVIVVAAAALTLYFPTIQGLLFPGEIVAEDLAAEEAINDYTKDAVFEPQEDPFRQVLNALEAGRPVLIKFYARW